MILPGRVGLYEENLTALGRVDSALADRIRASEPPASVSVMTARSGAYTMVLNGVSLHSRFDPVMEAETWCDTETIRNIRAQGLTPAVFGLGLGYHVISLAQGFKPVLVIEPNIGLIRLAFHYIDFRPHLSALQFITDPPAAAFPETVVLLAHPPYKRLFPQPHADWQRFFGDRDNAPSSPTSGEAVGDLRREWADIPGSVELLAGYDANETVGPDQLIRAVRQNRGALSELEGLVLLFQELRRGAP